MEKFLQIQKIHLRITTQSSMEQVKDFVERYTKTYLISHEDPEEHSHFHILMEYQNLDDKKHSKLRYDLKKSFGKGNGVYSISTVRNKNQLMKYVLKDDGKICYKNIDAELIKTMKRCSNKKGKNNFVAELNVLEEKLISMEITSREFKKRFVLLKVTYGQNLYPNHIRAYFHKMMIKRDPEYINQFIEEFL